MQFFATLIVVHPANEILDFCTTIPLQFQGEQVTGLEVLLKIWTETFEIIQGYKQIRLSVVALSRVFDSDVKPVMVKGEEITEPTQVGRIVTRSQRRNGTSRISQADIVRWTTIPVKSKILRLMIKELGNIIEGEESNAKFFAESKGKEKETNGDDEWEDEGGTGSDIEDWLDDDPHVYVDPDDPDGEHDVLKGVVTKVFPHSEN